MIEKLNVSFLPTEEDYVNMCLERQKYITPKENIIIFFITGIIGILSGTAGMINRSSYMSENICWLLLIASGLFVISYYDIIKPFIVYNAASKFYRYHEKDINSKTVNITEDTVTVNDELHKISIPRKNIYDIYEGRKTLFVFLDKEEFIYIPKRVIG